MYDPTGKRSIEQAATLAMLAAWIKDVSTCFLFGWSSHVPKGFPLQIPFFSSNVTYFLIASLEIRRLTS